MNTLLTYRHCHPRCAASHLFFSLFRQSVDRCWAMSGKMQSNDDSFDVPSEAPPAYEDVNSTSGRPAPSTLEKSSADLSATTSYAGESDFGRSQFALSSPGAGPSRPTARVLPSVITPKVRNDIRETIRGLVLNVLRDVSSGKLRYGEVKGVLDSCAGACMSNSLSFASILQERNIEGRSAVYWSILSMPSSSQQSHDGAGPNEFLLEFLSSAAPLSSEGVSELRAACLAIADNSLFQRLRSVPGLLPLSGPDCMLLASTHSHTSSGVSLSSSEERMNRPKVKDSTQAFGDLAQVYEGTLGSDADSFKVDLVIKMFQRRMRVSGSVAVEFIARGTYSLYIYFRLYRKHFSMSLGRIWALDFFVTPGPAGWLSPSINVSNSRTSSDPAPNTVLQAALEAARIRSLTLGSWAICLALLDGSMQCYARARLAISRQSSPPDLLSSNAQSDLNPSTPVILNLTSSGTSPLIAIPDNSLPNFPGEGARERSSRAARRQRMAQEPTYGQQGPTRLVGSVLFAGIENATSSGVSGRELMYEYVVLDFFCDFSSSIEAFLSYSGCPYLSPDGSLHAALEVQLSTSPPTSVECVIC